MPHSRHPMKFLLLISILVCTSSLDARAKDQIAALLPNELASFKNQWQCIGLTLEQLERRHGKGKRKPGDRNAHLPVFIFEKFDPHPKNRINWNIEVTMWQNIAGKPATAHQVRYTRQKRFHQEELDGLREINAQGLEWEKDGQKGVWRRYTTAMPDLPAPQLHDEQVALKGGDKNEVDPKLGAPVKILCKETVIYTQLLDQHRAGGIKQIPESVVNSVVKLPAKPLFGGAINAHIDELDQRLKKLGANLEEFDLAQNPSNDSSFIRTYRCREINLWSRGKWEIQASTWAGTGIIHEISYTKLDGPINSELQKELIGLNSPPQQLLAVSTPTMLPTQDKTITIRLRTKQLDELLEFKNQWQGIGLTLEQLEQRFGKGKLKLGQADPQFPVFTFKKFDAHPENKINWQIEVTMWQDQAGKPATAHQMRYQRMKRFTQTELDWLREINAYGLKWATNGQSGIWRRYVTTAPMSTDKPFKGKQRPLVAGDKNEVDAKLGAPVEPLCKETVIYSQALHEARHGDLVKR